MLRNKQFNLKFIHGLEQWTEKEVFELFSVQFEENKGFGFVDTQFDTSSIFSNFVYKTIAKQTTFDPTLNSLISHEQTLFYYVPFEINLKTNFLEAETSGRKLTKLISVIGVLFDFTISIDDIFIDFTNFLRVLEQAHLNYSIIGMTIENYRPEIGLSGRLVATIQDQKSAQTLIEQYPSDIRNIDILVEHKFTEMIWRLSSGGSITVRTEEEEIPTSVNLLKRMLIKSTNA